MLIAKSGLRLITISMLVNLFFGLASAQEENINVAEKLMIFQLEALKAKDHDKFVQHANKAFGEIMDEYMFESLVMQRQQKIISGYQLEYLGSIRTIGTLEYLWKIHITGDKYQLLGRLSLSHGKVVGFNLE